MIVLSIAHIRTTIISKGIQIVAYADDLTMLVKNRKILGFKFEMVHNFECLGIMINSKSENDHRIQKHKTYYKYKCIMKGKNTKRVYEAAIRPVVTYDVEMMNLTSLEQGKTLERKIVRRIYELKKIVDDEYRRLMNNEIKNILKRTIS